MNIDAGGVRLSFLVFWHDAGALTGSLESVSCDGDSRMAEAQVYK